MLHNFVSIRCISGFWSSNRFVVLCHFFFGLYFSNMPTVGSVLWQSRLSCHLQHCCFISNLANVPEKVVEGGSNTWAPATQAGESDEIPGSGLSQSCLLRPFGAWARGQISLCGFQSFPKVFILWFCSVLPLTSQEKLRGLVGTMRPWATYCVGRRDNPGLRNIPSVNIKCLLCDGCLWFHSQHFLQDSGTGAPNKCKLLSNDSEKTNKNK